VRVSGTCNQNEYVTNRVSECNATDGTDIRHPVYNGDRALLPAHFHMLQAKSGQNFTVDTCANENGDNALCDKFYSKADSFLQADISTAHIWCNPPFIMLEDCLTHYRNQKQKHPQTLSGCFLMPSKSVTALAPLLQGMVLLHTFPKGTTLFQGPRPDGTRAVLPPCPFSVSVYWDRPISTSEFSEGHSILSAAAQTRSLDMLFSGRVAGSHANVLLTPANILIDSGATAPFISPECAERLQLPIRRTMPGSARVRLADGSSIPSLGTCYATLTIGAFRSRLELIVAPLSSQFDVILGNTWLKQHEAILNYGDDSVTLVRGSRQYTISRAKHGVRPTTVVEPASDTTSNQPTDTDRAETTTRRARFAKRHLISANQAGNAVRKKNTKHFLVVIQHLQNADTMDSDLLSAIQHTGNVKLDKLLQQYADRFPDSLPKLSEDQSHAAPLYDGHTIPLEPGHKPPVRPIYRLSPLEFEELKKQIKELLALGFIQPSRSPYAAPVLFVLKKDGSLRMCIDYRSLNKLTIKNKYPLPRIDDLLDRLCGCSHFSSIDLRSGYYQLKIAPEDAPKTGFRCPLGHFQFTVLSMGLANAPASFQSAMNNIFSEYLHDFVVVYLDDILIFSKNEEDHFKHLTMVLEKLRQHNLYANAKKCEFLTPELEFLGHIVGKDGIKVDPKKTNSIQKWPTPTTTQELRAFLGLANYFRRFIQGYSTMVAPLTSLLKKERNMSHWDTTCDASFLAVKIALAKAPVLEHPDFNKPFDVICDASVHGVGAVLLQECKPIAFLSRKFGPAEYNYTTTEQELLAAVEALKQWRCYLEGVEFTMWTDHNPNVYMQTKATLSRREARWSELFQQFRFTWKHKPGKQNIADGLSRIPHLSFANHLVLATGTTVQDVISTMCHAMQLRPRHGRTPLFEAGTTHTAAPPSRKRKTRPTTDNDDTNIVDGYKHDPWFSHVANTTGLTLTDGLWWKNHYQLVVPDHNGLRVKFLHDAHDAEFSGHPGVDRTLNNLSRHYWWPGFRQDVRKYVAECDSCQRNKPSNLAKAGLLQPLPIPGAPWRTITMDLITDLPETDKGHDSVVVFVDKLTKMTHIAPCNKTISAEEFADVYLANVVRLHGFQEAIISDRDPRWTSEFWRQVCKLFETKLKFSTAFHPETDGQTERMNRTIEETLRHYVSPNHTDWDKHLPMIEFAINNAMQLSTSQTPFYMNTGFHPLTPLSQLNESSNTEAKAVRVAWQTRVKQATDKLKTAQNRQKQLVDSKRRDVTFKVNDTVLLNSKNINIKHAGSRKLLPRYIGPFKVTKCIGNVAYQIELPRNMKCHNVFHVSLLKAYKVSGRYQPLPPPLVIDDEYEYEVEQILTHKGTQPGKRKFLVAWKDYPAEHNTWEPESNLKNSPTVLQEYWASL
jgi:hypothetical protein